MCISEARVFISISYSERVVAMWSRFRGAGGLWRVGVWAEARNSGGRRDGDPGPCGHGGLQEQGQPHRAHSSWQVTTPSSTCIAQSYCIDASPHVRAESRAESFAQDLAKPAPRRHHAVERLQDNSTEGMHCIRKVGRSSLLIVARATGCTASVIGLRRKCIPCRIDAGKSTLPQP